VAGTVEAVPVARRMWRWAAGGGVLVLVLLVSCAVPFLPASSRDRVARWFARWLLAGLGVRLRCDPVARLSDGTGTLIAANHVSWLDVIALLAVEPAGMLAKRETRQWPLIGGIADRIGTVYADRERLRELPGTVTELTGALRSGRSMVVFPEATTWCGTSSGRFRPAMFQAAVDAGAPVRPVTVRYRLADGRPTTLPAFVGDDTLVASLRRIIGASGLTVEVTPGATLEPGMNRRALARAAEAVACPPADLPVSGSRHGLDLDRNWSSPIVSFITCPIPPKCGARERPDEQTPMADRRAERGHGIARGRRRSRRGPSGQR
jgi:1-acyl-sn-glycerol-3-phosphate acyltransferase